MSSIASRVLELRNELKTLAPGREIQVLAVAKQQPLEKVQEALAAGLTLFGNNYQQEGEVLREALSSHSDLQWHFIGHIQTRKVRHLLSYHCIQSLDRVELAQEFAKRLKVTGQSSPRFLIEVNIGKEPQKSGVMPEALPSFLEQVDALLPNAVEGLMAMPPALPNLEDRAQYFDEMRSLFEQLGKGRWKTLSMGTSEDYRIAVRCGSTMIRLGSSLLGSRPIRGA